MTKEQIDYVKEIIGIYDELIRLNEELRHEASKENDMLKANLCVGKIMAYWDARNALEYLLKM